MIRSYRGLTALFLIVLLSPLAVAQDSLEDRVDVLTEEVARLREAMAIPETAEELDSAYGMGPAASKVYGVRQGISLGGYGEFYFRSPIEEADESGAVRTADYYRFITYFGYKFNDRILMNTEIEFEHATTSSNYSGSSGSVSVEFSYLDFLINDRFNLRAGNLLVPSGTVNEMHEPPFYRGNFRPDIERLIIPSTWRELGVGAHGTLHEGLRYTAYVLNGLNGSKFDRKGVRGGRQKGNRALWEDVAGIIAAEYDHEGQILVGGSAYVGGADHGMIVDGSGDEVDVTNTILEGHVQFRHEGLEVKAMFAKGHIEGAEELTEFRYPTGGDDETLVVPEDQQGFYVQAGYDIAPFLLGDQTTAQVSPWFRYEKMNLHDGVPTLPGRPANASLDTETLTAGVDVKPHPNVVLKLDYVHFSNEADDVLSDEIRLGAGFVY